MKTRTVEFDEDAQTDLAAIYDWVADAASESVALRCTNRVVAFCLRLDVGAERGRRADHVRPGLRILGFEKRLNIAFVIAGDDLVILRIFYGGRDWEAALSE